METVVWNDNGKAGEVLTLLTMAPCRFILPPGMSLKIEKNPECPWPTHEYEIINIEDIANVWQNIKPGIINVICFLPFIIDPVIYSRVLSHVFKRLIRGAHDGIIPTPMSFFIDEFHTLAPSGGHGLGPKHYEIAAAIQLNIEQLRAWGIRIVATIQGNTKLRKGIRQEFNWPIIKRGANFNRSDEPKLSRFNYVWGKLTDLQLILVWPDRTFSDIINIDYYPRGREIGTIKYVGLFEAQP
jgi:hypothetical protein